MKLYEQMEQEKENGGPMNEQRSSFKEVDLHNKFKIQSLEGVTERSGESDEDSHFSYNSIDLASSNDLNNSFDAISGQDVNIRIKVMDELNKISSQKLQAIFGDAKNPTIPFTYDFEDFENCKLNIEIKKLINSMDLTLPIIY